jgi:hypothetical protein
MLIPGGELDGSNKVKIITPVTTLFFSIRLVYLVDTMPSLAYPLLGFATILLIIQFAISTAINFRINKSFVSYWNIFIFIFYLVFNRSYVGTCSDYASLIGKISDNRNNLSLVSRC